MAQESILKSIKTALGLGQDYNVFDADVTMHINSALSVLTQLGVGPVDGFMVNDSETTWDTLLIGSSQLNLVKTYVYLKVRLAFDPPANSFGITAIEKQISELEWRINVTVETELPDRIILDGGTP